jgi:hypothetical protein
VGWVKLLLGPVDRRARRPSAEPTAHQSLGAACIVLACGVLISCGGEPRLVPPANPSPAVVPTSTAVAAATPVSVVMESQIGDIVWATSTDPASNAPIDAVSSYRPDAPRIIAAVRTRALSAGSTVEATWEYNDTSLDAFTTRLNPSGSGAEQWISFHIARDPEVPWPVGTYELAISLDGTIVQQAAVEVSEQT